MLKLFILLSVKLILSAPSYCYDSSDPCFQYSKDCLDSDWFDMDMCGPYYRIGCLEEADGKCATVPICHPNRVYADNCNLFSPVCKGDAGLGCTLGTIQQQLGCELNPCNICVTPGRNAPGTNCTNPDPEENPGTNPDKPENPGTNPDNPENPGSNTDPENSGTNPGSSGSNPNQENRNTNQNKATAGIVVGVVLGVVAVAVVAVVIFLLIRRRRRNEQQSNNSGEGDSTKRRCLFNAEAEAAPASAWGTETERELNNVRGFPSQPHTRPPPQSTPASPLYPHPSSPSSSSLGRPFTPTRTHSPSLLPSSSANHSMVRPAGNFS